MYKIPSSNDLLPLLCVVQSHLINEDYDLHYRFLGSMLGKSMYEFQLVELPFAGFFLCKLAESGRGFVGAHHLASFDPDLYR